MIFDLLEDRPEMWEIVAAVQVLQASGANEIDIASGLALGCDLFIHAGFGWKAAQADIVLRLNEAKRETESTRRLYQQTLALVSGLPPALKIKPPHFPNLPLTVGISGGIVLCPFEIDSVMQLPHNGWRAIVRFLRSTGLPVYLMGDVGRRMDGCNFTEGEVLCNLPLRERMQALASANLVIGVPNAWTWMASSWDKKIVVFYPDGLPAERWFGFYESRNLGRVIFNRHHVQIPLLLAGLRRILAVM